MLEPLSEDFTKPKTESKQMLLHNNNRQNSDWTTANPTLIFATCILISDSF